MKTNIKEITKFMTAVQKAAYNDCYAGYYDKWYRYNHIDGGQSYDAAWLQAHKLFNPDTINFINA